MKEFNLNAQELRAAIPMMSVGDRVYLTGTVYTSRDAAHKEIFRLLDEGKEPPFSLKDAVIYYAGPTPGHDGMSVGSCGPTTSARMDGFAPRLYRLGLAATIGKGERNEEVIKAIKETGSIYFCAVGGAGALIAQHITEAKEIAFPQLGCESVKELHVENLPLVVAVDSTGRNIFDEARNS